MTEFDELMRGVIAAPDDDLPRLVLADWLDDRDRPDRAAFVRGQCELARTPAWEPFAVAARHFRPHLLHSQPFRHELPEIDGRSVEWHESLGYRRGFGHALVIRDLNYFLNHYDHLFDREPIAELHLPTAPLYDWHRLCKKPWLSRIRAVHFYGTTTPIDAVRELGVAAPGIEEVVFEKASSPAMPEVLARLFASPLGRNLKRLTLAVGYESVAELAEAFAGAPAGVRLQEFTVRTMGLTLAAIETLAAANILRGLRRLEVRNEPFAYRLLEYHQWPELEDVTVLGRTQSWPMLNVLSRGFTNLRRVRVDREQVQGRGWFSQAAERATLRSLAVVGSWWSERGFGQFLRGPYWPTLTELDLSDNALGPGMAKPLLKADVPADLTALVLSGNRVAEACEPKLRAKYGDRLVV